MPESRTFITADTHFGHKALPEKYGRPFDDVDHMDRIIIRNWNLRVQPGDTVWHVGDLAMCGMKRLDEILDRLNGQIHLVRGNHDYGIKNERAKRFASISDIATLRWGERRAILCHYPMTVWRDAHKGYKHFHGHCHGSLTDFRPGRVDVGADVWRFAPVPVEELFAVADSHGGYIPVDHHKVRK